jgi:glutamyl-tRNA reductase
MNLQIKTIGISHKTASMSRREEFESELKNFVSSIENKLSFENLEFIKISTCNRSELVLASIDSSNDIGDFIPEYFFKEGSYYLQQEDAIKHLFRVCAGLDSLVLGESQIFGQLKESYSKATNDKTLGPVLNKLFQESFRVAKKLRTHTNIGRGSLSVASVAVMQAERIYGDLNNIRALVIGAGETGTLVSKVLKQHDISQLFVCNRTFERAERLSMEIGAIPVPFTNYVSIIPLVDIVVLAVNTDSPVPLIDKAMLDKLGDRSEYSPFCILDLSMPRLTSEDVDDLDEVFRYSIDDLKPIVEDNLNLRLDEAVKAESLIDVEVENFLSWFINRPIASMISDIGKRILEEEENYNFSNMPFIEYRNKVNKCLNHFFVKFRSTNHSLKLNSVLIRRQILDYLGFNI